MTAETAGFISLFWLTFQHARELGGHVKKGEHRTPVVYASTFRKKKENEQGEEIAFLKEYYVFCANQCKGLGHQSDENFITP